MTIQRKFVKKVFRSMNHAGLFDHARHERGRAAGRLDGILLAGTLVAIWAFRWE